MKKPLWAASLGLVAATLACAPIGPFVWADEYVGQKPVDGEGYRIGVGDVISVRVYGQEANTAQARVRYDGMVSLPLLRDVQAAGLTPNVLAEQIQVRLKEFLNQPVVSVAIEESRPLSVPVLGEVAKQGQYTMGSGATVLEALAAAGGLTENADKERIFVLRREPALVRVRCTFQALVRGQGKASELRLRNGDTVVVE